MKRFVSMTRIVSRDRSVIAFLMLLLVGVPLLLCSAAEPGVAFLAFFAVLLAPFLLWSSIRRMQYLKRVVGTGDEAIARVANVESYRASRRDWFHTRLRVTCYYEYEGETHRFEESIEKDRRISKLEAGDELTLILDPQNPARAVIACLFSDGTPGTPPIHSAAGGLVSGVICSVGLLCVYWLPMLGEESPFTMFGQYTKEAGLLFWSLASFGYGLSVGWFAGMFAKPLKCAVAGAILLGLPSLLYMTLESVSGGLVSWSCALLVGGAAGALGGIVGRNSLAKQLRELGPALALQDKAKQLAAAKRKRAAEMEAAKEAAELEAAQAAEADANLDRCLSCGQVMETFVTCPRCGWTYLQ